MCSGRNMFEHYRTKGFVLKKVDQDEADQLFNIYTQDFGMTRILGRGIRKIASKLRAGIPVFGLTEVEFIQGKGYKTLTDAVLLNDFANIKKDLNKLKIASKISETFNELVKPPQKDEKIFQLLNETFNVLNNCSMFYVPCSMIYYYFFWNLISILGHKPELYECLNCRKKLEPNALFFSNQGGIICESCKHNQQEEVTAIDPNIIKILRELLKRDFNQFSKLKIKKQYQNSLEEISNFYLNNLRS